MSIRTTVAGFFCAVGLIQGAAQPLHAQDAARFPERPGRVIVPFPPGGVADLTGRVAAQAITEAWGRPFVVENRPGAGNVVGVMTVVKSPPDGHTLLLATTPVYTSPAMFDNLPYDPERDLVPVALALLIPGVLLVPPSYSVNSYAELIARARAEPGRINYASVGTGTFPHLAIEMLKQMAGIDLTHVPYKGFAPALTAILANEVPLMALDAPTALPQLAGGKVRALAVTSAKRVPAIPSVPTIAELGLKDYEAVGWLGVMAPAKTPRAIVDKLNAAINAGLAKPETAARYQGVELAQGSPEDFAAEIQRNQSRWLPVIRKGGIRGSN